MTMLQPPGNATVVGCWLSQKETDAPNCFGAGYRDDGRARAGITGRCTAMAHEMELETSKFISLK